MGKRRDVPSARPVRVGLAGCGRIAARFHLPVLAATAGIDLVAVAEPDPDRRRAAAGIAPGAAALAGHQELLDVHGLDAVVICLPSGAHAAAAEHALARGLHVYVEKPLATEVADGEQVVAAWRDAGTVGHVGFNLRFHPLVNELRDAVRAGTIGEPVGVRTAFCAARRDLPAWKAERGSGGGALLDLASHHVDLLRFLLDDEIVEVGALLRSVVSEDDTAAIELRLAGGTLASVFVSLSAVEDDRIEVYGTHGMIALDRYRSSRLRFTPERRGFGRVGRARALVHAAAHVPSAVGDLVSPPRETSFAAALASFADAARGVPHEAADLADGLRCLRVIAAAERAARDGTRIQIEERSDATPAEESGVSSGADR
jgi:predicted dehydrogenase